MAGRLRNRKPSKWAIIPEPPPGARYRGYLRYSERDLYTTAADKTTFQLQRADRSVRQAARLGLRRLG